MTSPNIASQKAQELTPLRPRQGSWTLTLCLNTQPTLQVILDIVNTHTTAPELVRSC